MDRQILVPKALSKGSVGMLGPIVREHQMYDHLHFDFQQLSEAGKIKVDELVTASAGRLTWQNFIRAEYNQVLEQLTRAGVQMGEESQALARVLSDQTLYGAPEAHLTAKFVGDSTSIEHGQFLELFDQGVELVKVIGGSGYIEGERVSFRASWLGGALDLKRDPVLCPVRTLQKVSLASLDRHFRTTELHVSFDSLSNVHPKLLLDLFAQGFYTAFRWNNRIGEYAVIATIQGFELEINLLLHDLYRWLDHEVKAGGIGCGAVIKKEDITRFCVFGTRPKLQDVVIPGSLG